MVVDELFHGDSRWRSNTHLVLCAQRQCRCFVRRHRTCFLKLHISTAISCVTALLSAICPQPHESDVAELLDSSWTSQVGRNRVKSSKGKKSLELLWLLLPFILYCYTTRIMLCKKYLSLFFRPQLKVHIIVLLLQAALSNTRHLVWYFRNKVLKQIKGEKKLDKGQKLHCSGAPHRQIKTKNCKFVFLLFAALKHPIKPKMK